MAGRQHCENWKLWIAGLCRGRDAEILTAGDWRADNMQSCRKVEL